MSSDTMLIHAGARQLCCVVRVLRARRARSCTSYAISLPMIRRVRVVSGH
jgi:hypothetical protein